MQWGNLSACFGDLKSGKFLPIQNKKAVNALMGYVYPARRASFVDCSVWWHFIFGVGVRCLFL